MSFSGICFVISFSPNSSFSFIFISRLFSFNIFLASESVFPIKSGTLTFCFCSSPSFGISKYGNTSLSICEPIGAATPPPWVILTTQILQILNYPFANSLMLADTPESSLMLTSQFIFCAACRGAKKASGSESRKPSV